MSKCLKGNYKFATQKRKDFKVRYLDLWIACTEWIVKPGLKEWEKKKNPLTLLVGMQTSTAAMENSVEIS